MSSRLARPLAVLAAGTLAGCAVIPSQRASFRVPTDVVRLTRHAAGVGGLEIRGAAADVRVTGGETDSIVLAVALRSQDARRLAETCVPRSELLLEPDGQRLVARLDQHSRDQCGEVWQVTVPASMPIVVRTTVGKIATMGLAGGLTIRIGSSGSVDASVAGGPVDARVGVGDVRVVSAQPAYRSVELRADVGRVVLEAAGLRVRPPRHGAGASFRSDGTGEHAVRLESGVGDVTLVIAPPVANR